MKPRTTVLQFAAAGCLALSAAGAAEGGVAVIAHRGWHQAPGVKGAENSIAALRAAQNAGFWGSEFDVHMTADEVLVVRHDDKIRGPNIWQQAYADIADFSLPNGERLPTLDEYLDQGAKSRSTMLVREVKTEGGDAKACRLADLCVEAVRRHGLLATNRILFISFNNAACKHLAEALPGFEVQCITTRDPALVAADGVSGIDFAFADYAKPARSNWIERAHALGLSVGAWTVNATNDIDATIARGVDAITSNYPDRVRDRLGAAERTLPVPAAPWAGIGDAETEAGVRGDFAAWSAQHGLIEPDDGDRILFGSARNDVDGDGRNAWEEFVALTDPTNRTDAFQARISFGADGRPAVEWAPNRPDVRNYELRATASLDEPFEVVDDPGDGLAPARFYRVEVRLKTDPEP